MSTKIDYRTTETEGIWQISQLDDDEKTASSMLVVQPHGRGARAYPCDVHMDKDLGGLLASQLVVDVASILLVALAADFNHIRFVLTSLLKVGKVSEITGASSFLEG